MAHGPEGHVLHWARLYDLGTALTGRRLRPIQRRLLERAAIVPGESVLDVGCGPGRLTLEAARVAGPSARIVGIDPSPEMIALAKRKSEQQHSTATFEVAPMQAIPAADGSFDVALACLVLHHVPPELLGRGLAEVRRVLKPDGRFVAVDFGASAKHGLAHYLAVLGRRRGFANADHLRSLLEAAGFEGARAERVPPAHCLLWGRKPRG
ncbi:MAG TPA: methyltransferase domain-containing protein [Myxococcales bacterium]|nr:methyltransferase domain-containing protein [Myxococcales bacterium]